MEEKVKYKQVTIPAELLYKSQCGIATANALSVYCSQKKKVTGNPHLCRTWGILAELFLAHIVNGISTDQLRSFQYSSGQPAARPDIDCRDYDSICSIILAEGSNLMLLDAEGKFNKSRVDISVMKEALDFIRDGQ